MGGGKHRFWKEMTVCADSFDPKERVVLLGDLKVEDGYALLQGIELERGFLIINENDVRLEERTCIS